MGLKGMKEIIFKEEVCYLLQCPHTLQRRLLYQMCLKLQRNNV